MARALTVMKLALWVRFPSRAPGLMMHDVTKYTGVYKITNIINSKIYIGSASYKYGIKDRWRKHKVAFKLNKNSRYLQASYNKYGASAFKYEVLLICEPKNCLKYEQYYLDSLKPWDKSIGYNICKIAGSTAGREVSSETRMKLSLAGKGRPAPHKRGPSPTKGSKLSLETRDRMSKAQKLRDRSSRFRAVDRIDVLTGECKEYPSVKAARSDGFPSVRECLAGHMESYKNYYWCYPINKE